MTFAINSTNTRDEVFVHTHIPTAAVLVLAAVCVLCAVGVSDQSEASASGTTGDCTWTFDGNDKLTITGTGAMGNYSPYSAAPWNGYYDRISQFVVEDGVTAVSTYAFADDAYLTSVTLGADVKTIGHYAFYRCTNLSSVNFPESLTAVNDYAFFSCRSLTSLDLPGSLDAVGYDSFSGCTSLKSVTLPDSMTLIGYYAFSECTGLTDAVIGKGLDHYGNGAFSGCTSLRNLHVADGNTYCKMKDGVLYTADGETLLQYTVAAAPAFEVPAEVTNILPGAFYKFTSLTSVNIPAGVEDVGSHTFNYCTSLNSVTFATGSTLREIETMAFGHCTSLACINIPSTVTAIDEEDSFYGITFVDIGGSILAKTVSNLAGHSFVESDSKLTRMSGTSHDCTWAYDYADRTLTVSGKGEMEGYSVIVPADWYFASRFVEHVVIEDGVTTVGSYAFIQCNNLKSVSLGKDVEIIDMYAFYQCVSLESVEIPGSVDLIGFYSFDMCRSLMSIVIPDNVETVGNYAFSLCEKLTSATVGKGVTIFGEGAFGGCSALTSIDVSADNPKFKTVDGVVYSKDGKTLVQYPAGAKAKSFDVPDEVTVISGAAFEHCAHLESVTIPAGVRSIDSETFFDSEALRTVTFDEGSALESLMYSCFAMCLKLSDISIPSTLTSVDVLVFDGLEFKDLTGYPVDWTDASQIAGHRFSGPSDGNLYCVDGTTGDCTWAYDYAAGALTVTGDGKMADYTIWDPAPWGTGVKDVSLSQGITYVGTRSFDGCKDLKSVTVPDSVRSMGTYVFNGCTSLQDATLGEGVSVIPEGTFNGCSGLVDIVADDGLTSIGKEAFRGCTSITLFYMFENIRHIGSGAFSNCTSLDEIVFQTESCADLDASADLFAGSCVNGARVYFEDTVRSIPANLFAVSDNSLVPKITYIDISSSVENIGDSAFGSLVFKNGDKEIPADAANLAGHAFRSSGAGEMSLVTVTDDSTFIALIIVAIVVAGVLALVMRGH